VVDRKTVEIAVDSRGVVAGLKEADKAFDQTARKADKAEKEVKQVGQTSHEAGRNMSAAFAATGGGLAITHGLEGIATGFKSGNSAMAAFAASQALLDLGRFAEDMKGVTEATGGATTVFGTLGAVMKAHPLMTIAAVLATAAGFMAAFGQETSEATEEVDRLADAMNKLQISEQTRQMLQLDPQQQQRLQQIEQVSDVFLSRMGSDQPMTYGEMSKMLGVPTQALARLGGAKLPELAQQQAGPTSIFGGLFRATGGQYPQLGEREFKNVEVDRRAATAILRTLHQDIQQQIQKATQDGKLPTSVTAGAAGPAGAAAALGPMGPPLPPGYERYADPSLLPFPQGRRAFTKPEMMGPFLPPGWSPYADPSLLPSIGSMAYPGRYNPDPQPLTGGAAPGTGLLGFGIDRMMEASIKLADYQREQADLAEQRMNELVALGEDFGATIGDAFFRVAEGTATARQAAAELVRMFAQMAATGIFRQIGGTIGGAFAPTQTQATANAAPES
jgi:hypothetical protein